MWQWVVKGCVGGNGRGLHRGLQVSHGRHMPGQPSDSVLLLFMRFSAGGARSNAECSHCKA